MFNANAPIKNSKKNLPSVKAVVQSVHAQHPQAVQVMGGVNAINGVISADMVTAGQALTAAAKTMPHIFPAMMQNMQNAMQADCRIALQKILKQLS